MRRLLLLCLLILVVGVLQVPAHAADPVRAAATLPGEFMGMVARDPHYEWNTHPSYPNEANHAFYDEMGRNLAAAGVKWVRFEFRAEDGISYDPNNPAQGIRFSNYDYFITVVAPRYGLKVIGLLASNLVRDVKYFRVEEIERTDQEVPDCQFYKYGCGTNLYMRIWLDRAFAIASRYQNYIAAYEVMNEENRYIIVDPTDPDFGRGVGISPAKMTTLLAKFYRIFKVNGGPDGSIGAGRNAVSIILGGLHPDRCADCGPAGMNDRQYLDAVYNSTAFADFRNTYGHYPMDGIGYHPYPMEMRSGLVPEETAYNDLYRVPARMAAIRQVMLSHGDYGNQVWVTEIGDRGAPHTVDPTGAYDNEQRQAQFLRTIYRMLWQNRDFVKTVLWFKYEDFAVPVPTPENPRPVGPMNYGVVRIVCRPLPGVPTCEYDTNGTVEVYKQSYLTYQKIANTGAGLETYTTFLPIVAR